MQRYNPKKAKRFRSAFTTEQVNYLEKQFQMFHYISNVQRKEVAAALNIPERAVKIWFQNRRMKEKKENTSNEFDDAQANRKSLESTQDQLSNVVSSTNTQPPLLNDFLQGNCYQNMDTNNDECNGSRQIKQVEGINNSAAKRTAPVTQNVVTTSKVVISPVSTSSIDSFKENNTNSFAKPSAEQQADKNKSKNVKKNEESKDIGIVDQAVKEDLSKSRNTNIPTMFSQQPPPGPVSNIPGFISLLPTTSPLYTQSYMYANGVIFNPLRVMPVVNSNPSLVTPLSNQLLNVPTVKKTKCNCKCCVEQENVNHAQYSVMPHSQCPQYVLTAIPYQNPGTSM